MYRILMTRYHKAYAIECDSEFADYDSSYYDNVFDENIHTFVDEGDVVVIMGDLDDFETYFPDYELEIVERDE